MSAIVVAFSDGLAMQYLADLQGIDIDTIMTVFDEMMEEASWATPNAKEKVSVS